MGYGIGVIDKEQELERAQGPFELVPTGMFDNSNVTCSDVNRWIESTEVGKSAQEKKMKNEKPTL